AEQSLRSSIEQGPLRDEHRYSLLTYVEGMLQLTEAYETRRRAQIEAECFSSQVGRDRDSMATAAQMLFGREYAARVVIAHEEREGRCDAIINPHFDFLFRYYFHSWAAEGEVWGRRAIIDEEQSVRVQRGAFERRQFWKALLLEHENFEVQE